MITKTFDFSSDPFGLLHFFREEPNIFFLDSSLSASSNGRYSFLGFDPFLVVRGTTLESFADFKKQFRTFAAAERSAVAPFTSGAVGYLSYDLGLMFQGLRSRKPSDDKTPLFHFGFYDVVLTIDHLEKKLHITSSGLPEMSPSSRKSRAEARGQEISRRVADAIDRKEIVVPKSVSAAGQLDLQSDCSKEEYISSVRQALEHIRQGDIYEINLSHKITARGEKNLLQPLYIYQRLRELSPSHFSAFYDAGDHQLLSSSPERFLSLKQGTAEIRPMKGTRPRGRTPDEDHRLRSELLTSEKEIAELLMVTDLERNDLGRVCEFGSVRVADMRTIEEYRTVFQATSTIEGKLRHDRDSFDLIEACFPGGSVTGCPKIRAMQIIDGLERSRRGIYTGAFGYLDFSGNLDFNILIRTLLLEDGRVSFHVGGGIVADSDPQMEYDETWVKAQAMMACLNESSGGHL